MNLNFLNTYHNIIKLQEWKEKEFHIVFVIEFKDILLLTHVINPNTLHYNLQVSNF